MTTDKRLYNEVARRITAMIDEEQFPPGSRLPGERDLAAQLGVSRVTVREAQIALQAQGKIEVRTGSGAKVLPPQPSQETLPKMSAFELTQARTLFEGEAAALAAATITDEELEKLDELIAHMTDDSTGNEALEQDADREFHLTIAKASKNAAIIDAIERLWRFRTEIDEIKQAYDSICGLTPEMRLAEHQDIATALRERDPAKARTAMRRHFACIIEAMLSTTEQKAIEEARRRTDETRQRFLESAESLM
ncbi:FadR/GntR family transcriptional regulator [Parvularcula marina]|uniref:FadR/GntR family transcriptional regulator n=1 Tax=Parvularcula marina TaxID=2292771 RepID=UPI003519BED8